MSSISDDIINGLDKSTEFTAKLSKLVHLPANKIKSLTEPLGLKDYMSLTKAVDEEDPEGAKRILLTGFNKLDPDTQKLIEMQLKEFLPALAAVPAALATAARVAGAVGSTAARGAMAATRAASKGARVVGKTGKQAAKKAVMKKYISKGSEQDAPSKGNTDGDNMIPIDTTPDTEPADTTQNPDPDRGASGFDDKVAKTMKQLTKNKDFAKIINIADFLAKNNKK